ncbi:MAG TPA: PQQ-binding-like beta-propeller repeat protein [Candidatus Ozemobacteraceae bacterium]|nr:PQQ-binding-like beta-propeller repeat protein [Candidatus Ozemobacteraceae bacterium]
MDEVVVVSQNPVKTVINPVSKPPAKPKPAGTFMNFFLMMPLAIVVLLQAFFFGKLIGSYTSLPVFTIQSYVFLGGLGVLMLLMHFMMRSIVYTSLFGFMLAAGVFNAWFGDFWTPFINNWREILGIMKTAWSKKDIPFPILMSGGISIILVGLTLANFFVSLFVKYFFEVLFGSEWADGRKYGYSAAILLLLGIHFGFASFAGEAGSRILWSRPDLYAPLEEYLARIPSAAQFGAEHVWSYDTSVAKAFKGATGDLIRSKEEKAAIPAPAWTRCDQPFIPTRQGLVCYDKDFLTQTASCSWPGKLPGLELPPEDASPDIGIPMLIRTDVAPGLVLAMFDYGYWGAVSLKTGAMLWIKGIDATQRINRYFTEEFLRSPYVAFANNILVFACQNARIVALKADTGDQLWEYQHKDTKYSGKGQRALLTISNDRVYAGFISGAVVTFDLAKGTKVYEARGSDWHPVTAPVPMKDECAFLSENGEYVRLQLDGGRISSRKMIMEHRLPLMPAAVDIANGYLGFKDILWKIDPADGKFEKAREFPKHIYAAGPVFEDKMMYIGTQDGWVIGMHRESYAEKWRVHVGGELTEESLVVADFGLLVRTKSGSLFCLRKGAE